LKCQDFVLEFFYEIQSAPHPSEEGFAVNVLGLPGCWSQGETEAEALKNIEIAIQEYFEAVQLLSENAISREVEVLA
jgi:predicted RNase H-like HicB family nuclease